MGPSTSIRTKCCRSLSDRRTFFRALCFYNCPTSLPSQSYFRKTLYIPSALPTFDAKSFRTGAAKKTKKAGKRKKTANSKITGLTSPPQECLDRKKVLKGFKQCFGDIGNALTPSTEWGGNGRSE